MTDAIDLKILARLQEDSTISLESLSESVGLSPTGCSRRIKRLEEQGVIRGRRAILDEKKLGFQVTAIFMLELDKDTPDIDRRMRQIVDSQPEIQDCYLTTGDYDFILIAKFREAADYTEYVYNFLETYRDIPIKSYSSKLVVRRVKQTSALPL